MAGLRANVIANFTGQGLVTVVQLAMIPVYVKWLGIEAYGLIGFQLTIQRLVQALDFGLTPTINRQLARYSVSAETAGESRDFVRTLEVIYWVIGVGIGLILFAAAEYVSRYWLGESTLPEADVRRALRVMAILVAVQWPVTLYEGGLLGLQRHAVLNAVRVAMTLLSAGGAYVVIAYVSRTVAALFTWQILVAVAHVLTLAVVLWKSLPSAAGPPRLRPATVRAVWRFAAGMTAISALGLLLTQVDKLVVSRLLPLEHFGYYMLAAVAAHGLSTLVRPVFTAFFPRLSALVAAQDVVAVRRVYRRAWQLMAALVVPVAAVVSVFAFELFSALTGDTRVGHEAAPIAALLVIGTAFNGLMHVPYALQLAYGWTRVGVVTNVLIAACTVPLVIALARAYGAVGAAAVWPALNIVYTAAVVPITHRRLSHVAGGNWLGRDVVAPAAAVVATVAVCRVMLPPLTGPVMVAAGVASVWLLAEATLIVSTPTLRRELGPW